MAMDPYIILLKNRKNYVNIYGDITLLYSAATKSRCAMKFLSKFISAIGLGQGHPSNDEEDFYTGKPTHLIPPVFRFALKLSSKVHVCDIRSLYDYGGDVLINPYTSEPVSYDDQERYTRQCRWLKKFRWPISHLNINGGECQISQLTVNTFSELSQFHYVDYKWFVDLTFRQLKLLYFYMYELWDFRLELTVEQKRAIIIDLELCSNYLTVQTLAYSEKNECKLRRELLHELSKLLSSSNSEAKKEGGLYFLLAMVLVSPEAAEAYPALYAASIY